LDPEEHKTVWSEAHVPDPPTQFVTPDLTNAAPMNTNIVPVIRGGKSFLISRGGTNARPMAQIPVATEVPRIAPNSFGHGWVVSI
jgi:hypothetical protein